MAVSLVQGGNKCHPMQQVPTSWGCCDANLAQCDSALHFYCDNACSSDGSNCGTCDDVCPALTSASSQPSAVIMAYSNAGD